MYDYKPKQEVSSILATNINVVDTNNNNGNNKNKF